MLDNKQKKYQFSPELAAQLESQMAQGRVARSDATARVSSGQTTQQVRRKKEIEDTVPKTRAEGRQRAANKAWERREQRRKSGKTIDQESSERAIAEATKPTGYTKLADFFHQLGEAAMTDALIMSGIVNPVRTAFSVVGGALGGNAVDKKMQNLTKSDEKPEGQTWSEWVNDKLGLRQGHMVGQFSNPGILLGGAVGYKTPGAIDYLVRADMPRFGITPTTQFFFKPNYLGANGSAVGKVEPFWDTKKFDLVKVTDKGQHLIKEKTTGKSYIAEIKFKKEAQNRGLNTSVSTTEEQKYERFLNDEFLPELKKLIETNADNQKIKTFFSSHNMSDRLSENDIRLLRKHAPYYNIPQRDSYSLVRPIIDKAIKDAKGAKGINKEIEQAQTDAYLRTPEGQLQAIRNRVVDNDTGETIWDIIEKSAKETGINWADDTKSNANTMLAGMDAQLKLTKVGGHSESFIERYYNNVLEHILGYDSKSHTFKNGFQKKILDSGDLRINPQTKQWEGKYLDGQFHPVRNPEEYIKVRYARDVKGADVELPIPDGSKHNYPMHGTKVSTIDYLTRRSSVPGYSKTGLGGYWTVRGDKLGQGSGAIEFYKGKGYSVPFFESPNLEVKPPFKAGISYELESKFPNYSSTVMRPLRVKDANYPEGRVNEYIFGPEAPNPKSSWNTLDFEPGAGPMAYTPTKITVVGNNYA